MKSIFGTVGLHSAAAWKKLGAQTATKCAALQKLALDECEHRGPSKKVIQYFDEISNELSMVADLGSAVVSLHDDPDIRDVARETVDNVLDQCEYLTASKTVYETLMQVKNSNIRLSTEESAIMNSLINEAKNNGGVCLKDAYREQCLAHRKTIRKLEAAFRMHINTHVPLITLNPGTLRKVAIQLGSGPQTLPLTGDLALRILQFVNNEEIREEAWRKSKTSAPINLGVLKELRKLRCQLASHLGYENYTHYKLSTSYFNGSLTNALKFLNEYQETLLPARKAERRWFQSCKKSGKVKPWDYLYYEYLYMHHYNYTAAGVGRSRPWFTVDNCFRGLEELVRTIFQLNLVPCDITKDESWVKDENRHFLRKYELRDLSNKLLGTIYMDMFRRDGKATNSIAAALPIRHRKRRLVLEDSTDSSLVGMQYSDQQEEIQTPIVVMFGNCEANSEGNLNRLTIDTLFHEFGHCMHAVLSETEYSSLSGTRLVSEDLVEFPSQLFEKFVQDPAFVQSWAKDIDGTPVPVEMINWMNHDRMLFSAYKNNETLNIAQFDLILNQGTAPTPEELLKMTAEVNDSYLPGTHFLTSVHHLVAYPGFYYCYPLGKYFAEKIWTKYEDKTALGDQLRSKFLSVGGVENSNTMMSNLFDGDADLHFSPEFKKTLTQGHLPGF